MQRFDRDAHDDCLQQHFAAALQAFLPVEAAIKAIPNHSFSERVAAMVATALRARIERSAFGYRDQARSASESLTDAAGVLAFMADSMACEQATQAGLGEG